MKEATLMNDVRRDLIDRTLDLASDLEDRNVAVREIQVQRVLHDAVAQMELDEATITALEKESFQKLAADILEWHDSTMPGGAAKAFCDKLQEEIEELRDDPGVPEAADVMIVLLSFMGTLGVENLMEATREKLEIIKRRKYEKNEHGNYHHL